MEWFWKIVDHLQKSVAGTALQSFAISDWVIIFAILWGLAQGSRKGFSDMFGKLVGIFLVSMLTLIFYPGGADYLTANLPALPLALVNPVAFFLFAVFFWISVSWCINVCGKLLKVEAQGALKTFGGGLLGILRVLLLISFVAQFLLFFPIDTVQDTFKQGRTYLGYTVSQMVPDLHKLVSASFHKPVAKKPVESSKVGG